MAVGTLLFSRPVDKDEAERCRCGFVRGFHEAFGETPDACCLDADLSDGIHCHFVWAGHSLTGGQQAVLRGAWPCGPVLLSHTHSGGAEDRDWDAYDRMLGEPKQGQSRDGDGRFRRV